MHWTAAPRNCVSDYAQRMADQRFRADADLRAAAFSRRRRFRAGKCICAHLREITEMARTSRLTHRPGFMSASHSLTVHPDRPPKSPKECVKHCPPAPTFLETASGRLRTGYADKLEKGIALLIISGKSPAAPIKYSNEQSINRHHQESRAHRENESIGMIISRRYPNVNKHRFATVAIGADERHRHRKMRTPANRSVKQERIPAVSYSAPAPRQPHRHSARPRRRLKLSAAPNPAMEISPGDRGIAVTADTAMINTSVSVRIRNKIWLRFIRIIGFDFRKNQCSANTLILPHPT